MDIKPVQIGDGSWLGSNVVVLPGVTIGSGVVISAGTVVNENIPDNVLYDGSIRPEHQDLPL